MTDENGALVKQLLLAKRSYVVGGHTKHEWVNPDGPEAADRIEALEAEVERLRGALAEVLNDDEALTDITWVRRARAALGERQ